MCTESSKGKPVAASVSGRVPSVGGGGNPIPGKRPWRKPTVREMDVGRGTATGATPFNLQSENAYYVPMS